MIDPSSARPAVPVEVPRDERSMRVIEYAMALVSVGVAILLALR
jgi:hypothetical protein